MNVALIYPDNDKALEAFYDQYKLESNTVVKICIQDFEVLSNSYFSEIPTITLNEFSSHILEQLVNEFKKDNSSPDLILLDQSLNIGHIVESLKKWKECEIVIVNKFYKSLKKQFPDSYVVLPSDKNPREIAEEINLFSPSIGLINIEEKYGNKKRQNFGGVELLLWLRVKHKVRFPIITIGYLSSQQILKKEPKHLVIHALGNLFLQMPFTTAQLSRQMDKMISDTKDFSGINESDYRDLYKPFLKPAFSIEEFRHREANWWGVKCLWDLHQLIDSAFDKNYPSSVQENFKNISSELSIFLYGYNKNDLKQLFKRNSLENLCNLKENLARQIRCLEEKIKLNTTLSSTLKGVGSENVKRFKHEAEIKKFELEKQYNATESEINNENQVNPETAEGLNKVTSEVKSLIEKLRQKNDLRIMYIDDNAEKGWSEIFKLIIPNSIIETIIPDTKYKNNLNGLYEENDEQGILKEACIKYKIQNTNPSVILLDLRLFDETETSISIENISGKILLQKIREDFTGIPVIIVTASNKIWSYQSLIQHGADAYWIKEGIDEQRSLNTVQNYNRFISLIYKITCDEYKYLNELCSFIKSIDLNQYWWQKEVSWLNGEITTCDTTKIKKLLEQSAELYRNYLQTYFLEQGRLTQSLDQTFIESSLINKLGNILEYIHCLKGKVDKKTNDGMVEERGDLHSIIIRELRNNASHSEYDIKIKPDDIQNMIKHILSYLQFQVSYVNSMVTISDKEDAQRKLIFNYNDLKYKSNRLSDSTFITILHKKKIQLEFKIPLPIDYFNQILFANVDFKEKIYPSILTSKIDNLPLLSGTKNIMIDTDTMILIGEQTAHGNSLVRLTPGCTSKLRSGNGKFILSYDGKNQKWQIKI